MKITKNAKTFARKLFWIGIIGFCLYAATWLAFYNQVCRPHLPAGFAVDPDIPQRGSYTDYLYLNPSDHNYYNFKMPHFGCFRCPVGFTNTYAWNIDPDTTVTEGFSYSFHGSIGWNGKIRRYSVMAWYSHAAENAPVSAAWFKLDAEGQLLNADDLNADQLALYDKAKPELLQCIEQVCTMYGC